MAGPPLAPRAYGARSEGVLSRGEPLSRTRCVRAVESPRQETRHVRFVGVSRVVLLTAGLSAHSYMHQDIFNVLDATALFVSLITLGVGLWIKWVLGTLSMVWATMPSRGSNVLPAAQTLDWEPGVGLGWPRS